MSCPFCGEEILTTAKKCKHCKEWLEKEAESEKEKKEINDEYSLHEMLGGYIGLF